MEVIENQNDINEEEINEEELRKEFFDYKIYATALKSGNFPILNTLSKFYCPKK